MATSVETGFGNKWKGNTCHLIRPEDSFNVKRKSDRFLQTFSFYHTLLDFSWPVFLMVVAGTYLFVNMLFADVYLLIGTEHLNGIRPEDGLPAFWEAFFFSTYAFTTVGYGRVDLTGIAANIVAAIVRP